MGYSQPCWNSQCAHRATNTYTHIHNNNNSVTESSFAPSFLFCAHDDPLFQGLPFLSTLPQLFTDLCSKPLDLVWVKNQCFRVFDRERGSSEDHLILKISACRIYHQLFVCISKAILVIQNQYFASHFQTCL